MAKCISCSSADLSEVKSYIYESETFKNYFPLLTILKCENCNLIQVDHSSIDNNKLTLYYRDSYRKDVGIATNVVPGTREYFVARGRTLMQLSRIYKDVNSVKAIIEIGAGYGYNLEQFKKHYTHAELYADELNSELLPKLVKSGKLEHDKYDIVILSHVLEHFVNPVDMLSKAIDALSTNGVLVIEVPNEGGGFICQSHGGEVFHEPHITFFGLDTLSNLINSNYPNIYVEYIGTCGPLIKNEMHRRNSFPVQIKNIVQRLLLRSPITYRLVHSTKNMLSGRGENGDYGLSTYSDSENSRLFIRVVLRKKKC